MFFDTGSSVRIVWLFMVFFALPAASQTYFKEHFGGSVGISVHVGTHVTGIGININSFYTDYFYQVNAGTKIGVFEHSYGDRHRFIESRSSLGAVLVFGKEDVPVDFQLNGLNHQTARNYGVGYNYVLYRDNAGTSQNSGGFALHLKQFSLYHENDAFGGQAKDRFRTAHALITYRTKDLKVGTGINLWTGETANSMWQRVSFDQCPNGFRALDDLPYGKTSHGIAYGGIWLNGPYKQIPELKAGIDSEQIRHSFQNRLFHDLIFLPKKIERSTPHYPRLDENGCPVFEKEDARKNRTYLQLGLNNNWSY